MFYSDTFRFATVSILKMVEILLNKLKISFISTFICNKKASTLYLNLVFVFFFCYSVSNERTQKYEYKRPKQDDRYSNG